MLADSDGHLRAVTTTAAPVELADLFDAQAVEGPCPDSYRRGEPVLVSDLADEPARWPHLTDTLRTAGIGGALAVPLKALDDETIGAVGLLTTQPSALTDHDMQITQSLADLTALGLVHHDAARRSRALAHQLYVALSTRVVIEQAKGVLAQRGGIDVGQAFDALFTYSRNNHVRLAEVCRQVVDGSRDATRILDLLPPAAVHRGHFPSASPLLRYGERADESADEGTDEGTDQREKDVG